MFWHNQSDKLQVFDKSIPHILTSIPSNFCQIRNFTYSTNNDHAQLTKVFLQHTYLPDQERKRQQRKIRNILNCCLLLIFLILKELPLVLVKSQSQLPKANGLKHSSGSQEMIENPETLLSQRQMLMIRKITSYFSQTNKSLVGFFILFVFLPPTRRFQWFYLEQMSHVVEKRDENDRWFMFLWKPMVLLWV